jgi:acetyl esterase
VIAGFDPLRDEGLAYAKRLQDAGSFSEVQHAKSLTHGFALYTALSRSAQTETEQFCMRTGELLRV